MTTSNLVVPMVLWGQNAPTHCVASIMMSPDQQHVITGCNDGQICVWEVKENWKVIVQFVANERKAAVFNHGSSRTYIFKSDVIVMCYSTI